MKKIILLFFFILCTSLPVSAATYQGNISKEGQTGVHRIVDAQTNVPITGAKITIPQKNYSTKTDSSGKFNLDADINGSTIMSVEKEGYKPFSLTVNEQIASRPITIGIEKSSPKDISIDNTMIHLGDNSFSENSANASEFRIESAGPYYTKNFKMDNTPGNSYLVIGSIIGIDTKLAQAMGQNKIKTAYSSPPEVFFNGVKISEIQLNGDGQRIKIPNNLIKRGANNEVTIKTGRNMMQMAHIDYDDIEFMNLSIETN